MVPKCAVLLGAVPSDTSPSLEDFSTLDYLSSALVDPAQADSVPVF
ncbi:MAG: hypothetical protein ACPGSB_07325 [Opitutales bacterium]